MRNIANLAGWAAICAAYSIPIAAAALALAVTAPLRKGQTP
jgi:hypothetical protein